MAEKVTTDSARPCRFNSSFLHSPFFGVSFVCLYLRGMAKIDCLAKDEIKSAVALFKQDSKTQQ